MENSWLEKSSNPNPKLLKPELNPLTNPILGRNLERWARVYFTSPPDKRDQAVAELLQELESEARGNVAGEADDHGNRAGVNFQEVACPACGQGNQAHQRFCGTCGSPLPASDFSSLERSAASAPPPREEDLDWLRQRAFSSLDQPEPASHIWKYLIVVTAMLLAGLFYLQWRSQPQSAPTPRPAQTAAATAAPSPAVPTETQQPAAEVPHAAEPATSDTAAAGENIEPKPAEKTAAPPAEKPGAVAEATPDSSAEPVGTESGSPELQLAQRYLQEGRPSDTTAAVKLLWKAVGKQNTAATLLLADLYIRGERVPRNCDQGRLLLVAAAKKGVTEAAQKLRNFESSGCR